jgi:hypothetical protein
VYLDDVAVVPGTVSASAFPIPTTTNVTVSSGISPNAHVTVFGNSNAPLLPSGAVPTGDVEIFLNGVDEGSTALGPDATASFPLSLRAGRGEATVTAVYEGDGYYAGSTGKYTVHTTSGAGESPTITAHVHSAHHKHHGWYRSAVTVSFTCTAGSNGLTQPCPSPVTLRKNGRNQVVSRTVYGYGGGSATATVYPINIDTHGPSVSVSGSHCTAHDSLSGHATCHVTFTGHGHWTATGTDRAGNVTVRRG